jgi:hypothetical protein
VPVKGVTLTLHALLLLFSELQTPKTNEQDLFL